MTATRTWTAWSCEVRLVVTDDAVADPAARLLRHLLHQVDRAASRFRADSALTRANDRAGEPTPADRLLLSLVATALDAARVTDGLVDPTVGGDLVDLGYDRDIALVRGVDVPPPATGRAWPADGPAAITLPAATAARPTWRDVVVDTDHNLLTVPAGTLLDLGATAKAVTADRAASSLQRRFGGGVLVELGGDLAVAGRAPAGGWRVAVAEAAGSARAERVTLDDGGLATSTTILRAWTQAGRPRHHLVDPRTGRPTAGPWRTATVAAPSALAANVASTAALVLGDAAPGWLERRGLAARLVATDGAVCRFGGWPAPVTTGRAAA